MALCSIMTDNSSNMINMTTDENGFKKAMRRIPCTTQTALYELLGNVQSIKDGIIAFYISSDYSEIYLFGQDTWTECDKNALHIKHGTGSSRGTASINGLGIKFVLDRMLDDENATYTIVDENKKYFECQIGHFTYSPWEELQPESKKYIDYLQKNMEYTIEKDKIEGTLIHIPISKGFRDRFRKIGMDDIKKMFKKFFNRVPQCENKTIIFNKEIQKFDPLCSNYINLDCSIVWDTKIVKSLSVKECLKINNYDEIKKYFPKLKKLIKLNSVTGKNIIKQEDLETEYEIKTKENIIENFNIRFSIVTKLEGEKQQGKYYGGRKGLGGLQIYFGNRCLTPNGICKHLGGKEGKNGQGGAIGEKYGGHERFEIELSNKNSILFNLPQDKTNIAPTTQGEKILRFLRILAELHPNTKNTVIYQNVQEMNDAKSEYLGNDILDYSQAVVAGDRTYDMNELYNTSNESDSYSDNEPENKTDNESDNESDKIDNSSDLIMNENNNIHMEVSECIGSKKTVHKKRGRGNPGYLYLYTLNSWTDKSINQKVARWGFTDRKIHKRLREHQHEHPIDKMIVLKVYWIDDIWGASKWEDKLLVEFEEKGYKYETHASETSEYIKKIDEVIELLDNHSQKFDWTEENASRISELF